MAWFKESPASAWRPRSPFGWFFWVALLGFFALAGLGLQEIVTELQTARWPEAPCEILSSGVARQVRSSVGFVAEVRYRYEWQGHSYVSDKIRLKQELIHSDVADAEARAAKFPKGARLKCHVNPANPRVAVLQSDPDYIVLVISPFLLVIWALVERVALADWFERRRMARRGPGKLPLTANRALRRARTRPLLVGVLGLLLVLTFASFGWIYPWTRQRSAGSWQTIPCSILEVGVVGETSHQGGRSFRPQVLYQYEFAGQLHKSSKLDFSADMNFSYARTRRLLRGYRPGQTATCFVNPAQPTQAVLVRRFRTDPFLNLFIAGFLGLSAFLIIQGLPRRGKLRNPNPWQTEPANAAAAPSLKLRPDTAPAPRLALSAAGVIAGCALAAWLLAPSWQSLRRGEFDILPLLYGLGAAIGAGYCLKCVWRYGRDVRRPGPVLKLAPAAIVPGEPFSVEWEWPRQARQTGFRLFLEGVESVQVMSEIATQHGASRDEKTQKWVFFNLPLTSGETFETSAFGQARGTLPPLTMHSFEGSKTKVLWRVRAEFAEPRGLSREYKVVVRPPKLPS